MQVDNFSVFFHLLIAAIVVVSLLGSLDYFNVTAESHIGHAGEYFALVLFGATGMMFMTSSVELLMVFIGLEISSISTYILAGFRKGQATASESSLKYFLLGSFATAFFLYGIALCFGATGSTSASAAIAAGIATTQDTEARLPRRRRWCSSASASKFPPLPSMCGRRTSTRVHPLPSSASCPRPPRPRPSPCCCASCSTPHPRMRDHWLPLIEVLAVLSMFVGNLGALAQRDVKRLLAYSSIAHAGYLLVAFASEQTTAVSTACFYTAAYAAMNVGAFLVLTQLAGPDESARTIDDFTGAALQRPGLAALLGFFLISLIGIPFTAGFFGKFYVFTGAIHGGHIWLAIIGLANSGIACFYYLRLLAALYARPASEQTAISQRRLSAPAALAIAAAAAATLTRR